MMIWKAFVPRFFAKSKMLTITTQAYCEQLGKLTGLQLSEDSTNIALISLLAATCCFCCSERLLEAIMVFRRYQRCGRVPVYSISSLGSKKSSSRSSASTEVVETRSDFNAHALSVSFTMIWLARSTMTCSRYCWLPEGQWSNQRPSNSSGANRAPSLFAKQDPRCVAIEVSLDE